MSEDILAPLRDVIAACAVAGSACAVIGAVARNAWAPPRATADFDLAVIVSPGTYPVLRNALLARNLKIVREICSDPVSTVPDLVLLKAPGAVVSRVDLLIAGTDFEREAVNCAVERDIGLTCRVVRPEHLIVYKLIAGRPRDLADVQTIIRTERLAGREPDMDLVRRWCVQWGVEAKLSAVLDEIEQEGS